MMMMIDAELEARLKRAEERAAAKGINATTESRLAYLENKVAAHGKELDAIGLTSESSIDKELAAIERRAAAEGFVWVTHWTSWQSAIQSGAKIYDKGELPEKVQEAIKNRMKLTGRKFGGTYHQEAANGVPVMNNGEPVLCSLEAWGELMASCYGTDEHSALEWSLL